MTERYEHIAALHAEGKSQRAIARELNIDRSTVALELRKASMRGLAPGLVKAQNVPGMMIGKTTVQYDADGKIIQEWRRLFPEARDVEAWVKSLEERVAGKAVKVKAPKVVKDDLLLEIPIPDHHMGMLAWGKETRGDDYDCDKATHLLVAGVASVIRESPAVGKIVISVMGDYYHADSRSQTTERSGHVLDCDSRFSKRVDAGIDALCQCVALAQAAAKQVELVFISGNHDWHSIKWLSRVMDAYYNQEKAVTVRPAITPRQYVRHGKVMLAYMHGDTMTAVKFAGLIPAEVPEMWAATEFRYGRVGHWHHRSTQEVPGVTVETLPTLAAPDSYASEHGYHSRRAITAFLWSAKFGLRSKMERCVAELMG
jgi:hypothetical protein